MKKLEDCKNLGKTIINNLDKIGINSYQDLKQIGPVNAYIELSNRFPDKAWPACYYLYSLEGALINKHWDDIGQKRKQELLTEIGRN